MEITPSASEPLPVPAPLYWGLDPLFRVHLKILCGHLTKLIHNTNPTEHATAPHVGFFRFHPTSTPRPLRLIEICGTIVYRAEDTKRIRIVVDDGSGVVRVNVWRSGLKGVVNDGCGDELMLGVLVRVWGRVEFWNENRDGSGERFVVVQAERVRVVKDVNCEWKWWLEVVVAHREVYCKAWSKVVDAETQKTLEESMPI